MPAVEIRFTALPAHVRTARLIAAAVARRAGVDNGLLDEIRLAVGEACSRAVGLHQSIAPNRPVTLTISEDADRITVTVADEVGDAEAAVPPDPLALVDPVGDDEALDVLPSGFGLAVIAGLVDDLDVARSPSGTVVRMTWKVPTPGAPGSAAPGAPA